MRLSGTREFDESALNGFVRRHGSCISCSLVVGIPLQRCLLTVASRLLSEWLEPTTSL
jgi:hypothetical protein